LQFAVSLSDDNSAESKNEERMAAKKKYLRRYTNLPALIYLLKERKITLLDPKSWDDSNDFHYLDLYRGKKKLKSVLALCFTQTDERYHHWRVFAGGSGGVCIRFRREELVKAVTQQSGLRTGPVKYLKLDEIRNLQLAIEDLPFLKRYAFGHEREFRMIYESKAHKVSNLDIAIPLSCISKITLSPWLHADLFPHVKTMLRSIEECGSLSIVKSTLIGNAEWKRLGEAAR
jgi:hypothetical protein